MSQAEINKAALAYWKQLSRYEYQIDFRLPLTPASLPAAEMTASYYVSDLQWDAFNTKAGKPYIPRKNSRPMNGGKFDVESQ